MDDREWWREAAGHGQSNVAHSVGLVAIDLCGTDQDSRCCCSSNHSPCSSLALNCLYFACSLRFHCATAEWPIGPCLASAFPFLYIPLTLLIMQTNYDAAAMSPSGGSHVMSESVSEQWLRSGSQQVQMKDRQRMNKIGKDSYETLVLLPAWKASLGNVREKFITYAVIYFAR